MKETVINLIAGGVGGTAGAVVTCPLEVIKTRLQSSALKAPPQGQSNGPASAANPLPASSTSTSTAYSPPNQKTSNSSNFKCGASKINSIRPPAVCPGVGRSERREYFLGKPRLKSTDCASLIGHFRSRLSGGAFFWAPWFTFNPSNHNSATANTNRTFNSHASSSCHNPATPGTSGSLRAERPFLANSGSDNFLSNKKTFGSLTGEPYSFGDGKRGLQQQTFQKQFRNSENWRSLNLFKHIIYIVKNEGLTGLWRGLGPTLIGVAPSRAIYFSAYSNVKSSLNGVMVPDTPFVHMFSAAVAGFCSASCTNPIWLIRTRLQLDRLTGSQKLTIYKCVKKVYQENGLKGFYRGVTASYAGITETIIHFVIYEYLKSTLTGNGSDGNRKPVHFLQYMLCAGTSRMIATTTAYPHEVLRTRLREEGVKYKGLIQSFRTIVAEETWRGLYSGLTVHLIRSIPNTAVTMATYELVVYLLRDGSWP